MKMSLRVPKGIFTCYFFNIYSFFAWMKVT